MELPIEYRKYIESCAVGTELVTGAPGYYQLWHPDEIESLNQSYEVAKHTPNYLGFGRDGQSILLAFDENGAICLIAAFQSGWRNKIADSWCEFIKNNSSQIPMNFLPEEYRKYIESGAAGSEPSTGAPGYYELWHPNKIESKNRGYEVAKHAPGYLGFGDDGSGRMLAFDESGAVYLMLFIGMADKEERCKIASSWSEFISNNSNDPE